MNCDKSDPDLLGPLEIDYLYLYNCTFYHYSFIFYIVSCIWIVTLISLLANTASNYFSPTLGSVCDKLKLAYDLAGVTLLGKP